MKDEKSIPGFFKILRSKLAEEHVAYTIAFILGSILCASIPIGIIVSGLIRIVDSLMKAL